MRRFSALLVLIVVFGLTNAVMGFTWTAGYYDHSTTPFDHNNNTAPINYPYGVGYLPSPGQLYDGGEDFDLEGFFVNFDDDYMYVAMTNSFGMDVVSPAWGTTFRQGDVFFGFGGEKNTFAIDVSTGNLVEVGAWDYIQDIGGSYYDDEYLRERVGAFEVTQGLDLGTASQTMTFWENLEYDPFYAPDGPLTPPEGVSGDTYVFEWKISRNLLNWDGTSEIFFHTTLGCGNDLIEYVHGAIPEPTTMVLLGLGLFGAGILARRK